jgi:7-cyano-7-deazaguanine reductase
MREIPLGKSTDYSGSCGPELLYAVARSDARDLAGIGRDLPFSGTDIWNAWELTWLDMKGKPVVATATILVDANSPNIIESKSLKLYLNSFAMTRHASKTDVADLIAGDLSQVAGCEVMVSVTSAADSTRDSISEFPGLCIDDLDIGTVPKTVNAELLRCEDSEEVDEDLFSHLLRSNCPVTNQPDMGSVLIRYRGPVIDRASLLAYIVSYRQHNDFHEACVERIFLDIKRRCSPRALTVYARYNRRGGIDINPFRTDAGVAPDNIRLWRQ